MSKQLSITGDLYSVKSSVCKILSDKLNMNLIKIGDIFRNEALKQGVSVLKYNKLIEGTDKDLEFDKVIMDYKDEENIIVDARLGWLFLPDSFKVYLSVDYDEMVERAKNAERGLEEKYNNYEELCNGLISRKGSEIKRFNGLYSIDYKNIDNYDLIINTTNMNINEIGNEIEKCYKRSIKSVEQCGDEINEEDIEEDIEEKIYELTLNKESFVSLENIDISIDEEHMDFFKQLDKLDIPSYLVGGAVRDYLLKNPYYDYDIFCLYNKEEFLNKLEDVEILADFDNVLIIYKEYVVYTISFNESFETDFNMRDYRINSLYYDWKKRCILGFKESFEDVIYSKLVPCNEELIEKDSLKLIRGIRLSRKLELSLKVNYMKLFQMDLADINSNFIAIRLRNEFF